MDEMISHSNAIAADVLPEIERRIAKFIGLWKKTIGEITSQKIHTIEKHILEKIRVDEVGLGFRSEQVTIYHIRTQ